MAPGPDPRLAWLRLALADGVGPRTARRLGDALGGVVPAAHAPRAAIVRALGLRRGEAVHRALAATRPRRVLDEAEALGQRVLVPSDEDWPEPLAALADPPLALFARGRLPPKGVPAVAIVGTRAAGAYGQRVATHLARSLAARGVFVVSGLALGIDAAAHRGALVGGAGGTLGVLGCAIDVPYPIEHQALKEEMLDRGGLLSEHPPGTAPRPGFFPRRNRLVAALSQVVVVVEAPHRSGALLTAGLALDLGREVLAVPGPVGVDGFRGSHGLLKRGAAGLCEGPGDVLRALGIGEPGGPDAAIPAREPPPPGPALRVWTAVEEAETVGLEELCRRTGLGPTDVAVGVAELELDGYLARVPGLGVRRV